MSVNPALDQLQAYPFTRMRALLAGIEANADFAAVNLAVGEPKHPVPALIKEALVSQLDTLSNYPLTRGSEALREAITAYLQRRYRLQHINSSDQVLPVNGTREALFAIAQCLIERKPDATVLMPNPFYQIYEGAALLAGAKPVYLNTSHDNGFLPNIDRITPEQWRHCQLFYLCSPGNPSGAVAPASLLQRLLDLSDQYQFTLVADECYAEIYPQDATPPLGLLALAEATGRTDYRNCLVFHSLSKRSNAPGLRSGFVAGDARLLEQFLKYRTYHGCAMSPPSQHASACAWQDDEHVIENRRLYGEKFDAVIDILKPVIDIQAPEAGFYLWLNIGAADTAFAKRLYQQYNVTVLPGSYLSRKADGINPGAGYIRIALVADLAHCADAATRIRDCIQR